MALGAWLSGGAGATGWTGGGAAAEAGGDTVMEAGDIDVPRGWLSIISAI